LDNGIKMNFTFQELMNVFYLPYFFII